MYLGVTFILIALLWPLLAKAITTDEVGYYTFPTELTALLAPRTPLFAVYLPRGEAQVSGIDNVAGSFTPETDSSEIVAQIHAVFPDAPIMYWVALNESGLDPAICNPSGACGLFQITGGTFQSCNVEGVRTELVPNLKCARILYDRNKLSDWEWSRYEGFDGGWGKRL